MAGKTVLWAVAVGDHMLQWIFHAKIDDLSECRWGWRDFSWLVSPQNTKPIGKSSLWCNHCTTWIILGREIIPRQPSSWLECENLPLWVPTVAHINPTLAGCVQVREHCLRESGLEVLIDMMDGNGGLRVWEERTNQQAPKCTKKAYEKLLGNLDLAKGGIVKAIDQIFFFLCELSDGKEVLIWEFVVPPNRVRPRYTPKAGLG